MFIEIQGEVLPRDWHGYFQLAKLLLVSLMLSQWKSNQLMGYLK